MKNRKPRTARFGTESQEARLAHLREQAPTLGASRRLRLYALFGSALLVLTVAAFYLAMQIYKAASEERAERVLVEVDRAPDLEASETEKALQRVELEAAELERELAQQLQALKQVDLLDLEEEGSSNTLEIPPLTGQEDEGSLEEADKEADDGSE